MVIHVFNNFIMGYAVVARVTVTGKFYGVADEG